MSALKKPKINRTTLAFILCLGLLALAYWGPNAIVHHIVTPRADDQRSGWRVRFHEPLQPGAARSYRDIIPAYVQNHLLPAYGALSAFAALHVSQTGYYRLILGLEGRGSVAVDGQPVILLRQSDQIEQRGESWVKLTNGFHVLRILLHRNGPQGSFSLSVQEPPLMRSRIIQGPEVIHIDMGSLETWWFLMAAGHRLRPLAWFGAGICGLAFLLPLTVLNRRRSVAVLVGIVLVPALALAPLESEEPYIGPMVHRTLQAKQPEFVFIGNSMLWSRIDDDHLSDLLGGPPVHSIVNFGGLSGIHYLALKYLLIDSGVKPKRTFIFFRSTTLVNPRARTRGPYFEDLIRRISPARDPLFQKIAYGHATSPKMRIMDWLEKRFPVMRSQFFLRDRLSHGATLLTVSLGQAADKNGKVDLRNRVNQRLEFGSLNAGGQNGLDVEAQGLENNDNFLDFEARVADSFLPAILDLAAQHDLPLAFIRVQQRPTAEGMRPDSPAMAKFIRSLEAYLTRHNAGFHDFTGDPAVTLDMYALGDHIRNSKEFSEIFYQRVGHLLQ